MQRNKMYRVRILIFCKINIKGIYGWLLRLNVTEPINNELITTRI